jgi:hypothetical protein
VSVAQVILMESLLEALPQKKEDNRKNVAILHFTSKHFGFLVAQVNLKESLPSGGFTTKERG